MNARPILVVRFNRRRPGGATSFRSSVVVTSLALLADRSVHRGACALGGGGPTGGQQERDQHGGERQRSGDRERLAVADGGRGVPVVLPQAQQPTGALLDHPLEL